MSLSAIDILSGLADGCSRAEDCAFWILTSAAAYLRGHRDDEPSTISVYFPEWARREGAKR